MNHASLFSGIGGFDLAAEWMGWNNVFNCEIDPFCQKVLKYHFPNSIQYADIKQTDFTIHSGQIDIITGGFPCQPFSTSGKRNGTEDDRYLWPEMLRAIREIQPGWIVGENVRGITNWNRGMVFDQVQADLEIEGFEILPFLLSACAVNAPHRRDRIWFIAHSNKRATGSSRESNWIIGKGCNYTNEQEKRGEQAEQRTGWSDVLQVTTNSEFERCKEQWETGTFKSNPTVPSVGGRVEPGFRGGNDGFSSRVDRIKALGNAIVPQVALQIFKAIEQYELIYNDSK